MLGLVWQTLMTEPWWEGFGEKDEVARSEIRTLVKGHGHFGDFEGAIVLYIKTI